MSIDLSVLTTNANKLDKYINENKKQEQDRKDKQLYYVIERKVKKAEHKRERPRSRDGTLKECKRLLKEGASPEVLTKLEESLREQEKYYRYYVQCFLPVLDEAIERSKKISNETKEQAISEITKSCLNRYNEQDSGYGSDFEDDHKAEINNKATHNNVQLLKAIKNKNHRKFRKYLKDCTNISGIKDEKGNNILHLIASLEKKQKLKFLGTLIKTTTIAQLVNSENQDGKTPFQVVLINKIIKEEHKSNTVRSGDNTLKFLTKLLEYGTKLSLPTENLEKLSKKQSEYYCKFLEKLAERNPEIKTKVEEVIAHVINTLNNDGDYPLHLAIKNKDEKLFKELLQKGADISLKDANGNNALHLIVTELKKKRKLEFFNIILNVSEKEQFKTQLTEAISAENTAKQTPLHQLLQYIDRKSQSPTDKEFKGTTRYQVLELFLQNGADITVQDKEGNNALHYIASFEGKQKTACLQLISDKDEFNNAVNTANKEGLTPLHQLFQHIKEKNKDRLCTDKKFEKTNRYQALELFLQNGADITAQDKEGNNILHHIASLKGEQKIACLNLILDLVKKEIVSKDKLDEAVKATNRQGNTSLELALKKKAMKEKRKYLSPLQKTTIFSRIIDNTTKFCAKLLEVGADSRFLKLEERFHTKKYYRALLNLENYSETPQEGKIKAKELRKKLEEKYNVRTFSKECQHILHKTGNGLKAAWKCIDPGRRASILLAITVATTIITMVTLSCFQGQIAIGAALPIIAITGVVCLIVTLGLSGIKKSVKELTIDGQGIHNPTVEQDKVFKNATQQNLENEHKDLEKQELQQRPLDQPSESPDTKMYDLSIMSLIRTCLSH